MGQNTGRLRSAVTIAKSSWLLLFLALICPAAIYSSRLQEFPGAQTELKSPDGRYSVVNIDSDKEPHHSLMLKNIGNGSVAPLHQYGRHVSVLWSPDSKKLVVNDYTGSSSATSLIFFVDRSATLDLQKELLKSLGESPDKISLTDNHHVYVVVSKWVDGQRVRLRVWGYGEVDPKGFSWQYVYTVGKSFRRLSRR